MYPSRSGKNVAANFENNKHKYLSRRGESEIGLLMLSKKRSL